MNPKNHAPRILLSVYACSPEWGSEVGTGWHWVLALSKFFPLHVITETGFRKSIEEHLSAFLGRFLPEFHYVDIGEKGREYFWRQGDWRFYRHYRVWQKKAFRTAETLHRAEPFDLVHQLGMIGFREPGYLWKLPGDFLFFWGPVGGMGEIPWSYLSMLGAKTGLLYFIKNCINIAQEYLLPRVRKAIRRADTIFAATVENKDCIAKIYHRDSILLNETGAEPHGKSGKKKRSGILQVVWCGIMESRKALNLGLAAVRELKQAGTPVKLHILGGGHAENRWRSLAEKLKIQDCCTWYGKVSPARVREVMEQADVMLLTSVKEGTPHVLLEALEHGLPVICHNAWGMSSVVNGQCGRLIPLATPEQSIRAFANAMQELSKNSAELEKLSSGALARAEELSWDSKAAIMRDYYLGALTETRKALS